MNLPVIINLVKRLWKLILGLSALASIVSVTPMVLDWVEKEPVDKAVTEPAPKSTAPPRRHTDSLPAAPPAVTPEPAPEPEPAPAAEPAPAQPSPPDANARKRAEYNRRLEEQRKQMDEKRKRFKEMNE
jgi:hypothetical protein